MPNFLRLSVAALISVFALTTNTRAQTLADRYTSYVCAIVHIGTTEGTGTGFFIDANGTIATAAHVVYARSFDKKGTTFIPHAKPISTITVQMGHGQSSKIEIPALKDADIQNGLNDVAHIKTALKPPCFLHMGSANNQKIGSHVLAIGFPATAVTPVLYDGFISGLALSSQIGVGAVTATGEPVNSTLNLLRVQMPITRGVS